MLNLLPCFTVQIQNGAEERNEEKITLLELMTTCSVTVGAITPRVNYKCKLREYRLF